MVLILHYLSHSGSLIVSDAPMTGRQITGQFIDSMCIVAVNVWVLISGYFLSKKSFKLTRILKLLAEVMFYTIVIYLIMLIVCPDAVAEIGGAYQTVLFFFPVSSAQFNFVTFYLLLYVIAPVLNAGIEHLSEKQLKTVIFGLLFWLCFIKSIVPVQFALDKNGYSLDWYICLYLIAAYIGRYDIKVLKSKRSGAVVYIISVLILFAVDTGFHEIIYNTGRFRTCENITSDYNYIFCLTGALGLFTAFRYMKIKEGFIADTARRLAPFSLGIYLIHEHGLIRGRWLTWMCAIFGDVPENPALFAGHLMACVAVLFICCAIADWLRSLLFDGVGRVCADTKLAGRLKKADTELAGCLNKSDTEPAKPDSDKI